MREDYSVTSTKFNDAVYLVKKTGTFADALAWILCLKCLIEMLVHYINDFFTCGKANTGECARNIEIIYNVFDSLGVPMAPEKLIGPITCLAYLGTEIDSVAQAIQLPPETFLDLVGILNFWHQQKKCTKPELLSLIGKLSFAAKVV